MRYRLYLLVALLLLLCSSCLGAEVQVVVTSDQGQPLKDALVIVQQLGPPDHELFRELTSTAGSVAIHSLGPGFYRAIATFPYSHWNTSVSEFLVREQPVKVELRMAEGDSLDDIPVSIGRLTVHLLDANGKPAAGARVLVRDAEAHAYSEHWGTTNAQGTTSLDLTAEPAVLLVVYRDRLYTFAANAFDTERTIQLK